MSDQLPLLPAAPTTRAEAPPDRVPRPSPCAECSEWKSRNQRLVAFVSSLGTPEAEAALRWQG